MSEVLFPDQLLVPKKKEKPMSEQFVYTQPRQRIVPPPQNVIEKIAGFVGRVVGYMTPFAVVTTFVALLLFGWQPWMWATVALVGFNLITTFIYLFTMALAQR